GCPMTNYMWSEFWSESLQTIRRESLVVPKWFIRQVTGRRGRCGCFRVTTVRWPPGRGQRQRHPGGRRRRAVCPRTFFGHPIPDHSHQGRPRTMNRLLPALLALAGGAAFGTPAHAQDAVSPADARAIARDAYVYGYPLVDSYRIQYAYFVDAK